MSKKLKPYISNITAKGYSSLFTGKADEINLCLINEKYLEEVYHSESRQIRYKDNWLKPVNFDEVLSPIAEYDIDLPLMQAVYSVFYQSLIDGKSFLEGSTLTIKRNTLAKYMDTNIRTGGYKIFWINLMQFNKVYALLSNGDIAKFLTLLYSDKEAEELKFDVTLLKEIMQRIQHENTVVIKKRHKKEFIYELPTHSFLIHSSISRKNKNAYYLVTQIEALLVQAGSSAEEVHIKFENLIDRVPTLENMLEGKTSANKNNLLKRTFIKLYEMLKTSTDLYEYYIDLEIPPTIPTQSTLDNVLRITHKGINKDYKPTLE